MAIQIHPNGTSDTVLPSEGQRFTLKELQSIVGGYVERLMLLETGLVMYINEEGTIMGLPANPVASMIFGRPLVGEVIVGSPLELDGSDA